MKNKEKILNTLQTDLEREKQIQFRPNRAHEKVKIRLTHLTKVTFRGIENTKNEINAVK